MRRRTLFGLAAGSLTAATLGNSRAAFAGPPGDAAALLTDTHHSPGPCADLVVAADGSGDFTGVQAAVDAVPAGNAAPFLIAIKPGVYSGQVIIPADKPHVRLQGLGRDPRQVVITDNRANGTPKPDGGTWGTSGSASVTIDGANFGARNLTFENGFDEVAHPEITGRQAVAVLTRADRLTFENVCFLGNQDTLYLNSSAATVRARVYLLRVYVEGDVDFVFGRASAVFEHSRIHSLDRGSATNNGYVTAPSTDASNPYGLLFQRCAFTSDASPASVYLGRPWHPSQDPNAIGQTLIRESALGAHIGPSPWSDFGTWPWRDARLAEYRNWGPGATVTPDRPQLTAVQAAALTPDAYLAGDDGWAPHR
jgi:pectinesterase